MNKRCAETAFGISPFGVRCTEDDGRAEDIKQTLLYRYAIQFKPQFIDCEPRDCHLKTMLPRASSGSPRVSKEDYVALASFREALRRFLNFSSEAAREAGLSAQQHQALLVLKGTPDRDFVSIGELAEHLHLKHHSAVGLVNRLAKRRRVKRIPAKNDRRKVNLVLTEQGEKLIHQLSAAHRNELRLSGPELRRQLEKIDSER